MINEKKVKDILSRYVPNDAVGICFSWIHQHAIRVRIKNSRNSKYGDYRPPQDGKTHTITINHDLNPFAFLITFAHEVAHLTCFKRYGHRVAPHGKEWKDEFRLHLFPLIQKDIFPDDLQLALRKYLHNPAASSCSDPLLAKTLLRYNKTHENWLHLEDLPAGQLFTIKNGKTFIKGPLIRKNYLCHEQGSGTPYHIHGLMEVLEVNEGVPF